MQLPNGVTVSRLAALLGVREALVRTTLDDLGELPAEVGAAVSRGAAEIAASELGFDVEEEAYEEDAARGPDTRAPTVSIMGHIDHGKTTLLDALRSSTVAASEAGGITQHIGAFRVAVPAQGGIPGTSYVTFLDTPGHQAFSEMRARGAQVTDIAVVVVAADEGVKPQTLEALAHADAAGTPVIVAITKCDRENADVAAAVQGLLEHGVPLEEAGGEVQVVPVSAPQGEGLDALLEAVWLLADMLDLSCENAGPVAGTVIESKKDKKLGAVATVLLQNGTLKRGDAVVVGQEHGKVRFMKDFKGADVKTAGPAFPVELVGLKDLPNPGDAIMVPESEALARKISASRKAARGRVGDTKGYGWGAGGRPLVNVSHRRGVSREKNWKWIRQRGQWRKQMNPVDASKEAEAAAFASMDDKTVDLNLVLKADTHGTLEALEESVRTLEEDTVRMKVVLKAVGPVTDSDVTLAKAGEAMIIGFNVKATNAQVQRLMEREGIRLYQHKVIYKLLDHLQSVIESLRYKEPKPYVTGSCRVLQTFTIQVSRQVGEKTIAGCKVSTGFISDAGIYRVVRAGEAIFEGRCHSLKHKASDVSQMDQGTECGLMLVGFDDFATGDTIECIDLNGAAWDKEDADGMESASGASGAPGKGEGEGRGVAARDGPRLSKGKVRK